MSNEYENPNHSLKNVLLIKSVLILIPFLVFWFLAIGFIAPTKMNLLFKYPAIAYIIIMIIWIPSYATSYAYKITDEGVYNKKGVLFEKEEYVPYNKISQITSETDPVSSLFGLSNIKIFSAFKDKPLRITGVKNHKELKQTIIDNINDENESKSNIKNNKLFSQLLVEGKDFLASFLKERIKDFIGEDSENDNDQDED